MCEDICKIIDEIEYIKEKIEFFTRYTSTSYPHITDYEATQIAGVLQDSINSKMRKLVSIARGGDY